ncbi:xanthine dehydrogenase family protein molybdopterin-binding subunit [Bradyrhizobium sp. GCM10027634]|uniref:xanthine dehydrogenase family protein molybdopterin-binding subunit n=1 Tax=unclassified Bradyrhizobium TaxID=2631580 RepID=UPI00188B3C54|nr:MULTISPECIES: xanthine dehydrogenase family protein molybdopterin-binding subunit [unclassified Bradyrhizobium]MDN5004334.1 xanthine dehydrogenase family protein molybdopterin-binding subunit [Bradyrhizobium sp. WYCCWR 12677]QOZ46999.1 xanthine dehydrogenase family protein molybdopterin-binding subunit [Bradyrhizobium sp. CCBAU 53340]
MNTGSFERYEGVLKVTGQARYEGEIAPEGMLHAALVESSLASGELQGLDASQAAALPGFATIVTHADGASLQPSAASALIREKAIHFHGQPVALVAAATLAEAREAARAVQVSITAGPAVTDMDQALNSAYAPATVGRFPAASRRGNSSDALGQAELVVRNRYATAVNNHHPMEPHVVVCWWEDGKAVVHTSTQAVFGTRAVIAQAFDMQAADIRVLSRFLGGGFGCKGQLWWPWMLWAMLASRKAGRPVRLELSRAQMFTLVGRRQQTTQDLALGFVDGRLTAIEHDAVAQTSTHAEFSDSTAVYTRFLYACPNVSTRHQLVRTNEPQPVPMRAPGTAPGTFALESAMDEAAELLGIDPLELRVRNFANHDQETGRPWSSNSLLECYRIGAERFGWANRHARSAAKRDRWKIGFGMATTLYPAIRQACRARVSLSRDGSLLVQCGTQDMGSGTYTALAQIAADALGVPMEKVTVELGDTFLPDGPFSGGSQVTASIFPAVEAATSKLRAALASAAIANPASPLSGKSPDDLEFRGEMIGSRSSNAGERLIDVLARAAPDGLEAEGESAATDHKNLAATGMGYGAIFVEIGVDPGLGEVRVRRVCGAFAAGRIVNPLLARSQYIGGLIGGIGMALHEQTVTDRGTGCILGKSFTDYLIPVHADMPEFDVAMIEEDDPHLPGGVKGIGMLGTAGIQAAIANAVHDAIGKRVRSLPIRIEDCLV